MYIKKFYDDIVITQKPNICHFDHREKTFINDHCTINKISLYVRDDKTYFQIACADFKLLTIAVFLSFKPVQLFFRQTNLVDGTREKQVLPHRQTSLQSLLPMLRPSTLLRFFLRNQ